jgi:CheY-like chemotaxis protein
MSRVLSGSPVPRHQVFVLDDGNPVVQWAETRVQEIYSGRARVFDYSLFGHPVSDYELAQLKTLGLIEYFNRQYVWVYALPEQGRYLGLRTIEGTAGQGRAFYLNTTLPDSELDSVVALLEERGVSEMFTVTPYDGIVAILGSDWEPYPTIAEAEGAQRTLLGMSSLFENSAVAFVEIAYTSPYVEEEEIDLETLIASQSASPVTEGKQAIVVCRDDDERREIEVALKGMKIDVYSAANGVDALHLMEECAASEWLPALLVMDVHLDDMHGWEMLSRMHEIHALDDMRVIALDGGADEDPTMAVAVAGVHAYLSRPLNMAFLRQRVYETLAG